MSVRLRFAPSPTGYLHIGGARTALFSWMFARRHNGQFILRIEDTDQKRFVEGAVEDIMSSMRWLGLDWDEGPDIGGPYGPYVQTERVELYQKWANWLVEHGHAYKCFATPAELAAMRQELEAKGDRSGYDRRYRDMPADQVAKLEAEGKPYVIRFKMPLDGVTVVEDLIRGSVTFENKQLTDYVLLKSSGLPTYHLAHVVDDHFMKITHITRGDEWLSTAPLHFQLWQAFGWKRPLYAHMPVILNPSGKGKLSKRTQSFQDGQWQVLVKVDEYEEQGYLPVAVNNFITNVGWSSGDDEEVFTVAEVIPRFDLSDVNPSPTSLPYAKLDWINGQHIQQMSDMELAQALKPFLEAAGYEVNVAVLLAVIPAMKVRLKRLTDAIDFLQFLFADDDAFDLTAEKLVHKQLPAEAAKQGYEQVLAFVQTTETFDLDTISSKVMGIAEKATLNGKAGPFLGKLRLAMTGQKVSPPVFESMLAMGRARCAARLQQVVALFTQT
ncbi:MAG: glutamate--tRNA ligase [Chloroflexi bacterium]|nr:MAG: glutamate--tRNA ligase [Chloroflexota bacterium]